MIERGDKAVSYPLQALIAFSFTLLMVGFYLACLQSTFIHQEREDIGIVAKSLDVSERLLSDPGQTDYLSMDWERDPSNISSLGLGARSIVSIINITTGELYVYSYRYGGKPSYYVSGPDYGERFNLTFNFSRRRPFIAIKLNSSDNYSNYPYDGKILLSPSLERLLIYIGTGASILAMDNNLVEVRLSKDFPYAILDIRKIENLTKIDYEKAKEALGIHHDFNITIINETKATILSYGKSFDSRSIVSVSTRNVLIRYPVLKGDHYIYIYKPAQLIVRVF